MICEALKNSSCLATLILNCMKKECSISVVHNGDNIIFEQCVQLEKKEQNISLKH